MSLDPKRHHSLELENTWEEYTQIVTSLPPNSQQQPKIIYLNHSASTIRLQNGPRTTFKVFGSPYSVSRQSSNDKSLFSAFTYTTESEEALRLWEKIPADTDLVITHTPACSHLDSKETERVSSGVQRKRQEEGCKILRNILGWKVRPALAVCGHIHEAHGYERVRWKQSSSETMQHDISIDEPELFTLKGILPPPGSKKQSLVDLTGRNRKRSQQDALALALDSYGFSSSLRSNQGRMAEGESENENDSPSEPRGNNDFTRIHSRRRETCIVNASIMATSWPYKGGFNSPIIVDINLPVCESQS